MIHKESYRYIQNCQSLRLLKPRNYNSKDTLNIIICNSAVDASQNLFMLKLKCNQCNIIILNIIFKERKFPKFISKEMEAMYIEELRSSVNLLMANLESLPVSKGGPEFKLQKLKRSQNSAFLDIGDENEIQLSKSDVVLSFTLEVSGLIWLCF